MTDAEVEKFWDSNADAWSVLTKAGGDIYRDYLNNPAFLSSLPDIKGLKGIDIGCGDGNNTRILASLGALMTGIDISGKFIKIAESNELNNDIFFKKATALNIPFPNEIFDFATGFMSFMDVCDINLLFKELHRILKEDGFVQFSISHPCFNPLNRKNIKDEQGQMCAVELSDYFSIESVVLEEWIFDNISEVPNCHLNRFKIPRFIRTLSQWFNVIVNNGFVVEMMNEPVPSQLAIESVPKIKAALIVPYFLHLRCKKVL